MSKAIVIGIASLSLGLNAYQWFQNRGLKVMLRDAGKSTGDKCAILKKAADSLSEDLTALKKDLNDLIDDITAGKVPGDQIAERVMQIYRKASEQPAPASEPEASPEKSPQTEAPAQASDTDPKTE